MGGFFTIFRNAQADLEIKRSKFIARSFKCVENDEALRAIREVRESFRDATHNCWAFRVGPTAECARASDDGEPHGTAGPPILSVLEQREATNTAIVVTRYFGGIKLGAGGLSRAYREAAQAVLDASLLIELRLRLEILAPVPYAALSAFDHHISLRGFDVVSRDFGEVVQVLLRIPVEQEADFRGIYSGLVGGRLTYRVRRKGYF